MFRINLLSVLLVAFLLSPVFAEDAPATDDKAKEHKGHSLKDIIEKADTNKDGKLDKDELAAIKNVKNQERLKKLDTNGDGIVDEKEIEVGLENAAKHTHPKKDAAAADSKEEKPADSKPAADTK